ncbi:MAG: gamma-glutamyl-gamma-aminobutyrate hydrolase family protein [Actinomycetota bacterium]
MPRTKLIGLTTYQFEIPWGPTKKLVSATPSTYYDLVAGAGGRPVLLPALRSDDPGLGAEEVVEALDGLVVIGGLDVDPSMYGAAPDPSLGTTDLARDQSELAVLRAALAADLPILAICRGHQLLNVALGGTLHQHVPDLLGHSDHQLGFGTYSSREVRLDPTSLTASVFGVTPTVSCSHHQVVDRLGEGLVPVGWSIEDDGTEPVIEAMERTSGRFCLSVQWHPEDRQDLRPFTALLNA